MTIRLLFVLCLVLIVKGELSVDMELGPPKDDNNNFQELLTDRVRALRDLTYDELEKVAQYFFGLLDDIDMFDDMAKSDDKVFRSMVMRRVVKRFNAADTDGYNVRFKPLS